MNPTFRNPHEVEDFPFEMWASGEEYQPRIFDWGERWRPSLIPTEFGDSTADYFFHAGSAIGQWPLLVGEVRPGSSTPRKTTLEELKEQVKELTASVQALTNLVEELRDTLSDARVGVGAIHSLNDGETQLSHPLFYGLREFEDDVLVSMGELGVTGVGVNENQAVREMQRTLWTVFTDMLEMPGGQSTSIVRAIQRRLDDGTGS